jgi:hypothetical protein
MDIMIPSDLRVSVSQGVRSQDALARKFVVIPGRATRLVVRVLTILKAASVSALKVTLRGVHVRVFVEG